MARGRGWWEGARTALVLGATIWLTVGSAVAMAAEPLDAVAGDAGEEAVAVESESSPGPAPHGDDGDAPEAGPAPQGDDGDAPEAGPAPHGADDGDERVPDLFVDDNGGEYGPVDHLGEVPWYLGATPGVVAAGAWEAGASGAGALVAVVDSGVDVVHPDLASRLATTAAPDGSGDTTGWNFRNGSHDVTDETGHGTHVAGVIARVAPDARILALKVIGPEGGHSSDAAAAIRHAVDAGADVVNASWSLTGYSPVLADAIAYAHAHGVVVVTSAGVGGLDLDTHTVHPHRGTPNVVLATATDREGALVPGSNHGTDVLGAPGMSIPAPQPGGGHGLRSGTSVAAAHVSGVAALAVSEGLTGTPAVDRLVRSAAATAAGTVIVDALAALTWTAADTPDEPEPTGAGSPETDATVAEDAGVDLQADSTFLVTNTNDSGAGSLRQAVLDANASSGPDEIGFAPDLTGSTIVLTSGELLVTQPLVVDGSGAPGISVDGNQASRIFRATADLTVRHLTIQNGRAPGGEGAGAGGGIRGENVAIVVEDSTIQFNTSTSLGGGIAADGASGSLLVERSLVLGNVAQNNCGGGGIMIASFTCSTGQPFGTAIVRNSTIAQNTSPGHGGGIHFHGGTFESYSSTIVFNESPQRGANVDFSSGTWSVSFGTVVGFPVGSPNCQGSPVARSYNFEVGTSSCGFGSADGNVSNGDDPGLGLLADNGGPTRTYLPAGDSPLLDQIPTDVIGECETPSVRTDQRGIARPQGAGCDVGAVEVGIGIQKSSVTVASGSAGNQMIVRVNAGAAQTNLTISDEVAPETSVTNVTASAGGDCSATSGNDVSCTWATVAPGSTATVTITFTVSVDVPKQTIVNTARVTSDETPTAASAQGIITVLGVFDVATELAPPVVAPGTAGHSLTIEVENISAFAQTGVIVTDEVDADLAVTGVTADLGGDCSATSGNDVSCTWATMAPGAVGTITVTYDVPLATAEASILNEVTVDSNEALPVTVADTITVATLALEKRFVEQYVAIGGTGYTIELTVSAVSDQTALVVEDSVPALFTVTNASADHGGDCSATSGSDVSCTWATLSSGTEATVTITYDAPTNNQFVSVVSNTATAQSDQSPVREASDTVTVTNIVVTNSFAQDVVDEGSAGNTFQVTVQNTLGSGQTVVVTNTVPAALSVTAADPSGNGNCSVSGNAVSCSWTGVGSGASVDVVVTYDVPVGSSGVVTNTAFGSASQTTPIPATDTVTIEATSASIAVETNTYPSGNSSTEFPFTVTSDATSIDPFSIIGEDTSPAFVVMPGTYTFTTDLPAGWELVEVAGAGGICTQHGGDAATLTVGAGDEVTCQLVASATTPARITVTTATVPEGDTTTPFPFAVTGPTPINSFPIVGEGSSPTFEVVPGTYTFTQAVPAGWTLSDVSGSGGICTQAANAASVTVALGDDVTCTFVTTADDAAFATVAVETVPSGDTDSPFEIVFAGEAAPSPIVIHGEGSRRVAVWPGTYTVGLVMAASWQVTTIGGSCDDDGTLVVDAGEEVDCTIVLTAGGGAGQDGGALQGPGSGPDDPLPPGAPGGGEFPPGTFGPDQPLEARLCPPGQRSSPPCVLVGTGTSNPDGSADLEYSIPPTTPPGIYELVVTDPLGNESVLTVFVGQPSTDTDGPGDGGSGGDGPGDGGPGGDGPGDGGPGAGGSAPDGSSNANPPDGELPFTGSGSTVPIVFLALLVTLAGAMLFASGPRRLAEPS